MVKTCTRCKIEKPVTEFSRNKGKKDGLESRCRTCRADYNRGYCKANAEKMRERTRKWQEANPDKTRERQRRWFEANLDKERERKHHWKKNNQERWRESDSIWKKTNKDRVVALNAKRRATKLRATPVWANLKAIEAIYAASARISKCLGIEHHVDHIVPLLGKNVCGLHVHNNLQVLPAKLNIAKGNKFTT
jgi:hypothetical protein